jgi:hypothetical protein
VKDAQPGKGNGIENIEFNLVLLFYFYYLNDPMFSLIHEGFFTLSKSTPEEENDPLCGLFAD